MSALAACSPSPPPAGNAADTSTLAAPAQAPASPAPEPWRYAPALAASVPSGVRAAPVLELADGLQGRARVVVAVAQGSAPVRLELWDFSQNNERGVLERSGEPQLLLDLHSLADADARLAAEPVADLRREIASPGSETVRPLGLPGEPADLPAELSRLAAASVGSGDASVRTQALALLIRGLDDELVWTRLPELLRRLRAAPWIAGEVTELSPRRVRISAREADRPLTLELNRKQDRWVLTAVTP